MRRRTERVTGPELAARHEANVSRRWKKVVRHVELTGYTIEEIPAGGAWALCKEGVQIGDAWDDHDACRQEAIRLMEENDYANY